MKAPGNGPFLGPENSDGYTGEGADGKPETLISVVDA
jgi:hypothetical protein